MQREHETKWHFLRMIQDPDFLNCKGCTYTGKWSWDENMIVYNSQPTRVPFFIVRIFIALLVSPYVSWIMFCKKESYMYHLVMHTYFFMCPNKHILYIVSFSFPSIIEDIMCRLCSLYPSKNKTNAINKF